MRFLPSLMVALVIITFFIIVFLSRHLTRSVGALQQGVQAFRDGNLSYRIPELSELEFQQLGDAFNTMATQLSDQRKELHDTNLRLEATVGERTRELQVSNRKLAEVDTKRRKLLADISHEFRTPLTGIRGEAEIALRGSDKTNLDYRDSFLRIMEQADNATRLVDDLLFIARADAGEPRLKLSSVAVAGMIDAVCEEFSPKAEQRGISIGKGRVDTKAYVRGDAGRLRQVFVILMDNALRYSNPGGRVEVRVLRTNEDVEITVTDTGIGLSDDHSELVFERFYRAPNAEAQASGTGLGLPVAKAIVEAHNGTISLKGKPGVGAIAIVTLPVGSHFGIAA
jgi:two-component system OmpR family sensor kinase